MQNIYVCKQKRKGTKASYTPSRKQCFCGSFKSNISMDDKQKYHRNWIKEVEIVYYESLNWMFSTKDNFHWNVYLSSLSKVNFI